MALNLDAERRRQFQDAGRAAMGDGEERFQVTGRPDPGQQGGQQRRFNPARIPQEQRSQAYQDYDTLMKGRPMEAGVRADGTWNSAVFQPNDDGTSAINPWIHANNMSPYRGEVAFKNYKGELETAPHYWADRKFSADLGMYGFNDISNRLKQLTEQYTTSLNEQTALSYANLGKQTGKSYVTSASEALRARLV